MAACCPGARNSRRANSASLIAASSGITTRMLVFTERWDHDAALAKQGRIPGSYPGSYPKGGAPCLRWRSLRCSASTPKCEVPERTLSGRKFGATEAKVRGSGVAAMASLQCSRKRSWVQPGRPGRRGTRGCGASAPSPVPTTGAKSPGRTAAVVVSRMRVTPRSRGAATFAPPSKVAAADNSTGRSRGTLARRLTRVPPSFSPRAMTISPLSRSRCVVSLTNEIRIACASSGHPEGFNNPNHAARRYSSIRPPSTSLRSPRVGVAPGTWAGRMPAGTARPRPRCGLSSR